MFFSHACRFASYLALAFSVWIVSNTSVLANPIQIEIEDFVAGDITIGGSGEFVGSRQVVAGQFADYEIDVAVAGSYRINVTQARQANQTINVRLELYSRNGSFIEELGRVELVNTTSFATSTENNLSEAVIDLPQGENTLRLVFEGNATNANFFTLTPLQTSDSGGGGGESVRVEIEDFVAGDITIGGSGEFVGSRQVVAGQFADYEIDVAVAGSYRINVTQARQANQTINVRLELYSRNGSFIEELGRVELVNTTSFATSTENNLSEAVIDLPQGENTLRLVFEGNATNANFFTLTPLQASGSGDGGTENIALGSVWRYLDDGSNQGTAWRARNFDDSSWASGPAQLGFGDGDEATTISFGPDATNKPITTYFRRSFNVADAATVSEIALNLLRDDGAVIYINGTEVARSNMPETGPIDYQTPATAGISGTGESEIIAINIDNSSLNVLRTGNNVIAVEIHQAAANSSDLSFDLGVTLTTTGNGGNDGGGNTGGNNGGGGTGEVIRIEAESWTSYENVNPGVVGEEPGIRDRGNGLITIGDINPGDALTYNINVAQSGDYDVVINSARGTANGQDVRFEILNSTQATEFITVMPTSGWGMFAEEGIATLSLQAGAQQLRVVFDGGINVDWFELRSSGSTGGGNNGGNDGDGQPPLSGEPVRIEAESWTSYENVNPGVVGEEPVIRDRGNGLITIGDINRGDALTYNINVAQSGDYDVVINSARGTANGQDVRFEILNSTQATEFITVMPTSGWGMFAEEGIATLSLQAGAQQLRVVFDGGINVDWFELRPSGSTSGDTDNIALGSVWRYLDDGSDQGTAWRAPDFNDSSWASGPAQLGYGEGDEATVLSFGNDTNNRHITSYYRRSFNVEDAATVSALSLDLLRDDGAVVYLNGIEAVRSNMPGGVITHNTRADKGVPTEEEGIFEGVLEPYELDPNLLVSGRNVIAVEVHQNQPASSDLSFDLALTIDTNASSSDDSTPLTSLIREAEEGERFGRFVVGNDANASGGKYIHVPDELGGAQAPGADRVDFSFNITQPGSYRIDANVYADNGNNNSFFVTVNNLPSNGHNWRVLQNTDYALDSVSSQETGQDPLIVDLNAGLNTLSVYLREDGTRLDRVELVRVGDSNNVPTTQPPSTINVNVGAQGNGQLQGTDPNGGSVTFELVGLAANGDVTLNANTGSFTYTNTSGLNGEDSFSYVAVDQNGNRSTVTDVNISVTGGQTNTVNTVNANLPIVTGSTEGAFTVTDQGQSSYMVPITVPPGRAGLAPELAIAYSSNGGNGSLGIGANLSGISVIHRCPQTLAQNNDIRPITYTSNDRFCLDGQQLFAVNGAYGANGTEYRTEIESYTRVISRESAGGSPRWFEVWTQSGLHMQFGHPNSTGHILAVTDAGELDNRPSTWAVNRISDTTNNHIDFTYSNDETRNTRTGEFYIEQINYAHRQQINFTYVDRGDPFEGYTAGRKFSRTKLLSRIVTRSDSQLVKDYRLRYNQSTASRHSRLRSIQECSVDSCFAPTEFTWQNGIFRVGGATTQAYPGLSSFNFIRPFDPDRTSFMDINDDGLQDVVVRGFGSRSNGLGQSTQTGPHSITVRENTGNGFSASRRITPSGFSSTNDSVNLIDDANGDGRPEIITTKVTIGCCGSPSTFVTSVRFSSGSNYDGPIEIGRGRFNQFNGLTARHVQSEDLNGDGLADLLYTVDGRNNNLSSGAGAVEQLGRVMLSTGDDFELQTSSAWQPNFGFEGFFMRSNSPSVSPITERNILDFNGDGITDLYRFSSNFIGPEITIWLGSPTGFIRQEWEIEDNNTSGTPQFTDINGDGLVDIYRLRSNGTSMRVWLSTGNRFVRQSNFTTPTTDRTDVRQLIDVNGDSRADLLIYRQDGGGDFTGTVDVSLSTGSSFLSPVRYASNLGEDIPRLADLNADGRFDLLQRPPRNPSSDTVRIHFAPNNQDLDQLVSIENGIGNKTDIEYGLLSTDSTLYTRTSNDSDISGERDQGIRRVIAPIRVVSRVETDDGIGGQHEVRYHYWNARISRLGRGFIGFRRLRETEDIHTNNTEALKTRTFDFRFPFIGQVISSSRRVANVTVESRVNTWAQRNSDEGRPYPYIATHVDTARELNGSVYKIDTTNITTVDQFGNVERMETLTNDGFIKRTTNEYTNNVVRWHLGRLVHSSVTHISPDNSQQTRASSFSYFNNNGLLRSETVEPNNNDLWQTTTYGYDQFGNQVSTTISGADIENRVTTVDYDNDGHFPIGMTNALDQSETTEYDARFGNVINQTGPNGLTTTWDYDSYGRQIREKRPDGTTTTMSYRDCSNGQCPSRARYLIETQASGAMPATAFYDNQTREIRRETLGFNGMVRVRTEYNRLGQVSRTSRPYYENDPILWETPTYDNRGRVRQVTAADGTVTRNIYNGLTTTTIVDENGADQQRVNVTNGLDQLVSVTDDDGNTIEYFYDPIGNLVRTRDSAGNETTLTYDIRGRKKTQNDPDMGLWTYEYNALDELVSQTDANQRAVNESTTMEYDKLGRLIRRTEREGVSVWTYDTAPGAGVGKLHRISRSSDNYEQSHTYDDYGRLANTATRIMDGTFDDTYAVTRGYDVFSRPETLIYPTGFATRNIYDYKGFLTHVRDAATNDDYWELKALNAAGAVTEEKLGNGLTTMNSVNDDNGYLTGISTGANIQNLSFEYDNLSNLMRRTDAIQNVDETFGYDNLNRLESMMSNQYGNKTYTYNAIGNITSKSDFGDDYRYGQRGAGPHAVTSVRSNGAVIASYDYDNNGNMTSGNGRTINYTSFNKPARITRGSNNFAEFSYSPERNRIFKTSSNGTTVYLNPDSGSGAHFEKESRDGVTHNRHFVYGGNGLAMIYTMRSNLTQDKRYTHKDHLGSIDTITNEMGKVVERISYDPFGKKRAPICAANDPICVTVSSVTTRGFTGHETIEEVGLIHMNGRVYDPDLGRFVSADPNIQFADNLQNYNRYSYVHNNPLSFTDPTGYFLSGISSFFSRFGGLIVRTLIGIGFTLATFGVGGGVGAVFIAGTVAGLISTGGDIQSGLISGLTAIAFFGIGHQFRNATVEFFNAVHVQKILLHGAVGGVSSRLQGGNFASGFFAAAGTQALAPAIDDVGFDGDVNDSAGKAARVAIAGAAGGAISALTGGSFANGAITGTFSRLFNDEAEHREAEPTEAQLDGARDQLIEALQLSVDEEFARLAALRDSRGLPGEQIGFLEFQLDVIDRALLLGELSLLGEDILVGLVEEAITLGGNTRRNIAFRIAQEAGFIGPPVPQIDTSGFSVTCSGNTCGVNVPDGRFLSCGDTFLACNR